MGTAGRGLGTTAGRKYCKKWCKHGKKFCRNPHYCRKLNSKYCKSSGRGRYSSYCKINRKKVSTQAKKCKWMRRVCVALSWRCRILRCRRRGKRSMKTIRRQAASNRRMKKKNPTPQEEKMAQAAKTPQGKNQRKIEAKTPQEGKTPQEDKTLQEKTPPTPQEEKNPTPPTPHKETKQ